MRTAKDIMRDAEATGRIWVNGEMEFPDGQGPEKAFAEAYRIGCECGYMVARTARGAFRIEGGDMPGYVTLDWYDSHRLELSRVDVCVPDSAHRSRFTQEPG